MGLALNVNGPRHYTVAAKASDDSLFHSPLATRHSPLATQLPAAARASPFLDASHNAMYGCKSCIIF
jgi:hypothetical protein